jgi:hypothetical protein
MLATLHTLQNNKNLLQTSDVFVYGYTKYKIDGEQGYIFCEQYLLASKQIDMAGLQRHFGEKTELFLDLFRFFKNLASVFLLNIN